jgi:protein-S-isoprenylcysteine O-methyltransferase Ste14
MLDRVEQIVVTLLYGLLVVRLWPSDFSDADWYPMLILLSEGIVVFFLLIRRPTERISVRFQDWAIAFGGTLLPLSIIEGGEPVHAGVGAILMLTGLYIHVGAKLSLRRSFGLVAADRGIKARGLYALVRHPMYFGYMVAHLGYLLVAPAWWNLIAYAGAWSLLVARIYAEEFLLQGNPEYREYSARVRYRLVPMLF